MPLGYVPPDPRRPRLELLELEQCEELEELEALLEDELEAQELEAKNDRQAAAMEARWKA